jgi:starch synthase
MDILFVATELAPLVKIGGLADVVAALSKALRQLGHKVTVALPRFAPIAESGLLVARRLTPLTFSLGPGGPLEVTVYDGRLGSGVEIVLFDVPGLYDRRGVYGEEGVDYPDNAFRFAVLSRAAAELVRQRKAAGSPFDIVHAHDWPAALVPVYLRELEGAAAALPGTVFTVHNLAHQGLFSRDVLSQVGLGDSLFVPEQLEFYGRVNFMKGGLVASRKLTTVSPTYANEIQTAARGHGLEGVLSSRTKDLAGITNGIDYATWNPATDAALVSRYDAEDPSNKERCKTAALRELGFSVSSPGPLVLHVGRMVRQKGTDLCLDILPKLVFAGATVVMVGDGDAALVARATEAVEPFADQARFVRAASEPVVHRLFAAADIVLVPSRFEPCGLVQLYGQRYGALPVARATGGLCDTIVDCDAALETGTGFLFREAEAQELLAATQRALAAYATPRWPALRRRTMRLDLGWDRPARRYEQVYRGAVAR